MKKLFISTLLAFCCLHAVTLAQTSDTAASDIGAPQTKLGLQTLDGQTLPLSSMSSKVLITGAYAQVQHNQVYLNQNENEVELVYYYSKGQDAILNGISAIWQQGQVQAALMTKIEAEAAYKTLSSEEVEGSSIDARISSALVLGKVPAKASVTIQYSVIQPLEVIANQFYGFSLFSSLLDSVDLNTQSWKNSVNLNNYFLNNTVGNWNLEVTVITTSQLAKALNPSHGAQPAYSQIANDFYAKWTTVIDLSKDFVLFYTHPKIDQPDYTFTKHPAIAADWTFSVTFLPKLNNVDSNDIAAAIQNGSTIQEINKLTEAKDAANARGEYIFAIDATANVSETVLGQIKSAVASYLKKLPNKSTFNIIAYGNGISSYKSSSQAVFSVNYNAAINWLKKVKAANGSADLLAAVTHINNIAQNNNYPRTVYLFTASESANQSEILKQVYNNKKNTRYCAIAAGNAGLALAENIGKLGNCGSEAVTENETVEAKALNLFSNTLAPSYQDLTLNFSCNNTLGNITYSATEKAGDIQKGTSYTKTWFMSGLENPQGCKISFTYTSTFANVIYTKSYNFKGFSLATTEDAWHKIGAKAQIAALAEEHAVNQADDNVTTKITQLSLQYGVGSDNTDLIAYDLAKMAIVKDSIIALYYEKIVQIPDNTTNPDNSTDNGNSTIPDHSEGSIFLSISDDGDISYTSSESSDSELPDVDLPVDNNTTVPDAPTLPADNTTVPDAPTLPADNTTVPDAPTLPADNTTVPDAPTLPADNTTIPADGNNSTNSTTPDDIPIDTPADGNGQTPDTNTTLPANPTPNNSTNSSSGHFSSSFNVTIIISGKIVTNTTIKTTTSSSTNNSTNSTSNSNGQGKGKGGKNSSGNVQVTVNGQTYKPDNSSNNNSNSSNTSNNANTNNGTTPEVAVLPAVNNTATDANNTTTEPATDKPAEPQPAAPVAEVLPAAPVDANNGNNATEAPVAQPEAKPEAQPAADGQNARRFLSKHF